MLSLTLTPLTDRLIYLLFGVASHSIGPRYSSLESTDEGYEFQDDMTAAQNEMYQ